MSQADKAYKDGVAAGQQGKPADPPKDPVLRDKYLAGVKDGQNK